MMNKNQQGTSNIGSSTSKVSGNTQGVGKGQNVQQSAAGGLESDDEITSGRQNVGSGAKQGSGKGLETRGADMDEDEEQVTGKGAGNKAEPHLQAGQYGQQGQQRQQGQQSQQSQQSQQNQRSQKNH